MAPDTGMDAEKLLPFEAVFPSKHPDYVHNRNACPQALNIFFLLICYEWNSGCSLKHTDLYKTTKVLQSPEELPGTFLKQL